MNAQYDVVVKGDGCTGGVAKQQILLVMSFRPRPTGNLEIGEPTAARAPLLSSAVAGWISQGRCRSGRIRERGWVCWRWCVRASGWLAGIYLGCDADRSTAAAASTTLASPCAPLFCSPGPKTKVSHASLKT